MADIAKFRPGFHRAATADATTSIELTQHDDTKTRAVAEQASINEDPDKPTTLDRGLQRGVQNVELITQSWSKTSLIAVFANIWLLYFVNYFSSSILYNLVPFVTSAYDSHSLLNVIYIVSNAMTAAMYIPLSKVLDVWGRAEGFALMVVSAILGLILMATCNGLPMFCAAYVFWSIGTGGMTYCVDVVIADISTLRNRGLAYAFTSSPYMITAFAGAKASEQFYENISWRWASGVFAIVFPIVAAPLFFILNMDLRKAQKQVFDDTSRSGRSLLESIWHYTLGFDLFGVILFSAGLTVFLLPFTIASNAPNGWASGYIIAMLVVGAVLLIGFGVFEWKIAPVPMLNFTFLSDRTLGGACLLDATYQVAYYCWANYFSSFLKVVNDLSISEAGYVGNASDVVSQVLLLLVGYAIRRTRRFKRLLYGAVHIYILAQGLMIRFRQPNQSVGYLVFTQILISFGGSIFVIVFQVAILAAVDHQHVAAALALLFVVGTVGDALGATISGGIWTNTFKQALVRNLPPSAKPDLEKIYEGLDKQLSYKVGGAVRLAIQKSYGYAQTRMLAAGTSFMGLSIIWTLMIRNINVGEVTQVHGAVF